MAVKLSSRAAKGAKTKRATKTRVLFDELMAGVEAMRRQRESKTRSSRS